jgi:hypothetical protein
MIQLTPASVAQLKAEQRAGRAAVRKAKLKLDAERRREREAERMLARNPRVRAKLRKARQAAVDAAIARAIERAARRAALLAEIAQLPETALISDRHGAAFLGTEVSVLHCWGDTGGGPKRYIGADSTFVRYQLKDLIEWMSQRSGEAVETSGAAGHEPASTHAVPQGAGTFAPQLAWARDRSEDAQSTPANNEIADSHGPSE